MPKRDKTARLLGRIRNQSNVKVSKDIAGEFILPNHSGIAAHRESNQNYLRLDGTNKPSTDFVWTSGLTVNDFAVQLDHGKRMDVNLISLYGDNFWIPEIDFNGIGSIKDYLYIRSDTAAIYFTNAEVTDLCTITYTSATSTLSFANATTYTFDGTLSATNLSGTNTGDQDLSPYFKKDGSVAMTGDINLGDNDLTNGTNITIEDGLFTITTTQAGTYGLKITNPAYNDFHFLSSGASTYWGVSGPPSIGNLSGSKALIFDDNNSNLYLSGYTLKSENQIVVGNSSSGVSINYKENSIEPTGAFADIGTSGTPFEIIYVGVVDLGADTIADGDPTNWDTAYTHSQIAGGNSVHVSVTENTNWDTAYTHSQDNSQAHSDYLINNGNDTMAGVLTCDGLTMGANENITLGSQTLDHDGTDFVFSDDVYFGKSAYGGTKLIHAARMNIADSGYLTASTGSTILGAFGYPGPYDIDMMAFDGTGAGITFYDDLHMNNNDIDGITNLYSTNLIIYGNTTLGNAASDTITIDGDTWFANSGSGLPYGAFYQTAGSTFTVTLTTQNTAYELNAATTNINAGALNLCTFPDDHYILVQKAGVYNIDYSGDAEIDSVAGGNQHVEFGLMINGTAQAPGATHIEFTALGQENSFSAGAILTLTANQQVSIYAKNTSSGGKVITIDHLNLKLVQIGG